MSKLKRKIFVSIIDRRKTNQVHKSKIIGNIKRAFLKRGLRFFFDADFPLNIFLEISRTCNYHCPMCIRDKLEIKEGYFDLNLAKKIASEASKYGATSYSLHLHGEPLLHEDFYELFSILKGAHPYNKLILTTNASKMTRICSQKLFNLGVDTIFISIPSFDPEKYSKLTGGKGDVASLYKNLLDHADLKKNYPKTKTVLRLFEQVPDYEDQISLLKNKGFLIEYRKYHNFTNRNNKYTQLREVNFRWPCVRPWFSLVVNVFGKVTACNLDYAGKLYLGDANSEKLSDIWKSTALKKIRMLHKNKQWNDIEICSVCDAWQYDPNMF